jgi:hypothetical protein
MRRRRLLADLAADPRGGRDNVLGAQAYEDFVQMRQIPHFEIDDHLGVVRNLLHNLDIVDICFVSHNSHLRYTIFPISQRAYQRALLIKVKRAVNSFAGGQCGPDL